MVRNKSSLLSNSWQIDKFSGCSFLIQLLLTHEASTNHFQYFLGSINQRSTNINWAELGHGPAQEVLDLGWFGRAIRWQIQLDAQRRGHVDTYPPQHVGMDR
jgi:hypothetical protein